MPFIKNDPRINRKGRPLKGESYAEMLVKALNDIAYTKGKHLIQHAVEMAYENPSVLVAILKKILPDKQHMDGLEIKSITYQINSPQVLSKSEHERLNVNSRERIID